MPKLWTDTIESHRETVHGAVLDAAAGLVAAHGLAGITMSAIAEATGIGRATLYKYFPDVDAVLAGWHERQIGRHMAQLADVAHRPGPPGARLEAVLNAYVQNAFGQRARHDAALLHGGEHTRHARRHLQGFLGGLIAEAQKVGEARGDIAADELAIYCLAALDGAATLTSKAATARLVVLVMATLAPQKKKGSSRRP